MNKSLFTNVAALILCVIGLFSPVYGNFIFSTGIFALSGGITNWLAIHMLFEKVPFLYGSGVIPNRFEDFKRGIKNLIVTEFFSSCHIERFFQEGNNADTVLARINFDRVFADLSDAIESSSLGGMLSMVGGKKALEPLREPIILKLKEMVINFSENQTDDENFSEILVGKIETIIDQRLLELTPQDIKKIVQTMIQQHLGWLVVWGGVLGGFIGLIVESMKLF